MDLDRDIPEGSFISDTNPSSTQICMARLCLQEPADVRSARRCDQGWGT